MTALVLRPWRDDDAAGLALMLDTHMADDPGWPPLVRRDADVLGWFAAPCDTGRWVAERDGRTVGHVGLHRVQDPKDLAMWHLVLAAHDLAEVVRGLIHPTERSMGTGARLTGVAVRHAVSAGLVPVATALDDRAGAQVMMARHGWRCIDRRPSVSDPARDVLFFVPPDEVVRAATAHRPLTTAPGDGRLTL